MSIECLGCSYTPTCIISMSTINQKWSIINQWLKKIACMWCVMQKGVNGRFHPMSPFRITRHINYEDWVFIMNECMGCGLLSMLATYHILSCDRFSIAGIFGIIGLILLYQPFLIDQSISLIQLGLNSMGGCCPHIQLEKQKLFIFSDRVVRHLWNFVPTHGKMPFE